MISSPAYEVSCSEPNSMRRSRLKTRRSDDTVNLIEGASVYGESCVGTQFSKPYQRPFRFTLVPSSLSELSSD